ncbi:hypothetical protein [Amycolatopsis suaedae]|uniref:hypothetical protein n=1 Tax=Amycolatopsis suaedae TaxID=2510978 RepID=UPI00196A8C2B|nr:hypothetical protein [Amycolatopsis suaedae]
MTVTAEVARQVRRWRAEPAGMTWREIATEADAVWGTDSAGDQRFGMALCEASAKVLGEDPAAEPWN